LHMPPWWWCGVDWVVVGCGRTADSTLRLSNPTSVLKAVAVMATPSVPPPELINTAQFMFRP
jgi:hypothetical protein